MSYIGKSPSVGNFVKLDALTASATASYTMQLNSVNYTPESANHMLVSLNGVIQNPGTSFTVSGSTLTFASTLASSDSIDFIMVYGNVLDIGTPSDNTVSQAKLVNESVNEAKMQISNAGTNGQYLQKQSGNTGGLTWADAGLTGWSTGGTQNSLIPSHTTQGIYLGVSSATAANLLDDYEEGTWSPALGNFGGSSESFVAPRYTKIGRLVTVSCQLQIGSFPSDGSTFLITGLPFTVKNEGGTTFGTVPFRYTGTNVPGLTIGDNNTQIEMYQVGNSGGQFNYNDFGQSKQMAFVAQYETA